MGKNVMLAGLNVADNKLSAVNTQNNALMCSNVGTNEVHVMESYNYGAAGGANTDYLILTDQNTNFNSNNFQPPKSGQPVQFFIRTSVNTILNVIKLNCIDLFGKVLILYVRLTAAFTTAQTGSIASTSLQRAYNNEGPFISLTTDIHWINSIEVATGNMTSGIVYVYCQNYFTLYTQVMGHYYLRNPIFCCPTGYTAYFNGIYRQQQNGTPIINLLVYPAVGVFDTPSAGTYTFKITALSTDYSFLFDPPTIAIKSGDFAVFNRDNTYTGNGNHIFSYFTLVPNNN
jgi:hypothetical protein